jgi:hypothetical protein
VQWLSSGLGGYLTGRLRTKWVGIHTDETFFRDTAHGFMAWARDNAGRFRARLGAVFGDRHRRAGGFDRCLRSRDGSLCRCNANAGEGSGTDATSYFVDALFRPSDPARLAAPGAEGDAAFQASRILVASAAAGEVSADDKTYLGQLVAVRTGLYQADATARVDAVLAPAQEAADAARKAGATFALLGALSLIIGAFIASAAAALGGRQRDDEETLYLTDRR